MKAKIKLLDKSFGHSVLGYCSDYQTSELFEWDRINPVTIDDIVVITDMMLPYPVIGANNVGWLHEPIEFSPQNYEMMGKMVKSYCKVFTHEKTLLDLGRPYDFVPGGSCWIKPEDQQLYEKNKTVSIIASSKSQITGHRLRHDVINKFRDKMDVYGRGWNPIEYKLTGLKDYRYTIVIENCKRDYWFTEKLLDALVTGTVPIYWGCPSIGKFFDVRGFIIFDNLNELESELANLTEARFDEMRPYIEANFEAAKQYMLPDEWIFRGINSIK